ncbi:MAG: GtrA family protein [Nanoarchaeota archaeon]
MEKAKVAKKFFKYNLTMSMQFITDFFLLWFFTDLLGVYYIFSAILSVLFSSVIGHTLSKRYVFDKSKKKFKESYPIFLGVTIVKLFAIVIFLFLFVDVLGIYYLLARILTGIIIVIFMYVVHTKITFKTDFE